MLKAKLRSTRRTSVVLIFAVFWSVETSGQTTHDAPSFEVASVKLVATLPSPISDRLPPEVVDQLGFRGGPGTNSPNRIDYSGVTLMMLLAKAYNLTPAQISGPTWLNTQRYDVAANLPPLTGADELRLMLQGLLTERFQIKLHHESRLSSVYELVIARSGPKLKPAEKLEDYKDDQDRKTAMRERAKAAMDSMKEGERVGHGRTLYLRNATVTKLAESLSFYVDRPVKDGTHLQGRYYFALRWNPSIALNDSESGTSIFGAIEEQLGLRLQPEKEQVELLMIDKVERIPTSN